jgi:5-methylcytosine-specific restriction endonuclease McrA
MIKNITYSMLVLNADFTPLNMTSFKKGYKLIYKGRAEIISAEENCFIRSEKTCVQKPIVIRLTNYVLVPFRRIVLSKVNIFRRDKFTCVYCGSKHELSIDHVVPKSKGGQNTWNNLVTSCLTCNHKKGNKSLEESGLKMNCEPTIPSYMSFLSKEQFDKININLNK